MEERLLLEEESSNHIALETEVILEPEDNDEEIKQLLAKFKANPNLLNEVYQGNDWRSGSTPFYWFTAYEGTKWLDQNPELIAAITEKTLNADRKLPYLLSSPLSCLAKENIDFLVNHPELRAKISVKGLNSSLGTSLGSPATYLLGSEKGRKLLCQDKALRDKLLVESIFACIDKMPDILEKAGSVELLSLLSTEIKDKLYAVYGPIIEKFLAAKNNHPDLSFTASPSQSHKFFAPKVNIIVTTTPGMQKKREAEKEERQRKPGGP